MKEIVFISAAPDDDYFVWQYEVQINNFRKYGLSSQMRILMFLPSDRVATGWNPKMKALAERCPEVKFFWYEDKQDILNNYVRPFSYIPLLRPYCLALHFKEYPELEKVPLFYLDSDVVFTRQPDFSRLIEGDVCYVSDTKSYIAASYWDSKEKDVKPDMLALYKTRDILDETAKLLGIDRKIAEANEEGSGGAQYFLKGVDYKFWQDVFMGCIRIRGHLSAHMPKTVNSTFFENEDKGFQSWCADMWSVLWNLWKRGKKTECPPEMDFAWATDKIEKWDKVQLFHDAGAGLDPLIDENGKAHDLFFKKGKIGFEYANNRAMPYEAADLPFISPEYCSSKYVQEILDTKKANNY